MAESRLSYSDKLRDPRWQKKRLEILQRDKFTCQHCNETQEELHVHHKTYIKGRAPWDYDGELLITLCKSCHDSVGDTRNKIDSLLSESDIHHYTFRFLCKLLQEQADPLPIHKILGCLYHSQQLLVPLQSLLFEVWHIQFKLNEFEKSEKAQQNGE